MNDTKVKDDGLVRASQVYKWWTAIDPEAWSKDWFYKYLRSDQFRDKVQTVPGATPRGNATYIKASDARDLVNNLKKGIHTTRKNKKSRPLIKTRDGGSTTSDLSKRSSDNGLDQQQITWHKRQPISTPKQPSNVITHKSQEHDRLLIHVALWILFLLALAVAIWLWSVAMSAFALY